MIQVMLERSPATHFAQSCWVNEEISQIKTCITVPDK